MHDNYMKIFESLDFDQIKDHPNILIAASFWEEERYQAAQTCYKYLRTIDDLIDGHKSRHATITGIEKQELLEQVHSWIDSIKDISVRATLQPELAEIMSKFHLPFWPLENFAKAMIYDINHNGFNSLDDFITYSQGASVAPASIFVHLSGLQSKGNGFLPPAFNVRKASEPCAMFSYIVHIIRDFQKDHENNLNYFAHDVLARNGLTLKKVREIASGGKITSGFRNMMSEYYRLADKYRSNIYQIIDEIRNHIEPRYHLSLLIIFDLYLMVFEKINCTEGSFTTEELNPTPEEIKQRVFQTVSQFSYV